MVDLFASAERDFDARAISPVRELGAYEALWFRRETTFKTLAEAFRNRPGSLPSDFVSEAERQKFAKQALGAIRSAGIRHFGIRVHGAGEYPQQLRVAAHPVELLYFQGDWTLTSSPCVAIVGTRSPTEEGVRRAQRLTRLFVDDGWTIVSGLAKGIDTVVHREALARGGRTIAVIGTPITEVYPRENAELQRTISDQQLVIGQVPIVRYSTQTYRGNRLFFPERNITMSALTAATVIVEAGNTSGTLIQAKAALDQKRKLFILDSCFERSDLTWPARFEALGAIRVSDFEMIRTSLAAEQIPKDRGDLPSESSVSA